MPSWFGGGCLGWTIAIIFWCVLTVLFPILLIGWAVIIGGILAGLGGGGGA